MAQADLTHLAQQVTRLNNRTAWRAICQALGNAGIPPGRGCGIAAKAVWAERKAIRRAAKAAGLPWRPLGKAQIRALHRQSKAAMPVAPHRHSAQSSPRG
jgi:cobalamin biosynthesis protein CbiG